MSSNPKNLTFSNALRLRSKALSFFEFSSPEELADYVVKNSLGIEDLCIIGEGTNTVFPRVFNSTVLKSNNDHITFVDDDLSITVGAGCNWDYLVEECSMNGLHGLENLAGIPGSVGAAPIQNIGAYGKEISEHLVTVEVFDLADQKIKQLTNEECNFGYRTSIFQSKRNFVVTSVTLRLESNFLPHMAYKDLQNSKVSNSKEMIDLIRATRERKLPDRSSFPNLGSFFKNPVLTTAEYSKNKNLHSLKNLWQEKDIVKLSAAELIESAGLKGIKINNVGVSLQHALVLTCTGLATQLDVINMANLIKTRVKQAFDIELVAEPDFL